MFILNFISFLKHPTLNGYSPQVQDFKLGIFNVVKCYFLYLMFVVPCFLFLSAIDSLILKHYYNYSILSQFKITIQNIESRFDNYAFILIIFIGPLLEETLFRLPISFNRTSVGLSVSLLAYRLSGNHLFYFDAHEIYSYARIVIAIITFVSVIFLIPLKLIENLKEKYFKSSFYISAILFALVHVTNFAPYNNSVLFFYPLYTLPQFIMGLSIGYLRVKQGFFWGWILHAMINLPATLTLLSKH